MPLFRWEQPLCADAFSNFQSPLREEENRRHNEQVRAATAWVETEGVVRVARALLNISELSARSLSRVFHSLGVNMRYLGLVYSELVSSALYDRARESLYTLVLCESVARVFKVTAPRSEMILLTSFASSYRRGFGQSCASSRARPSRSWRRPAPMR